MSEPGAVYETLINRPPRRALDVLDFICRFKAKSGGDSPSYEEIARGVGSGRAG